MKLHEISFKNIKNNLRDYGMYMISMSFSVLVYYIFKTIEYNKSIIEFLQSNNKLSPVFSASASILLIFVFIFIWYSSSFFVRRRKKEIGIYALLGMKPKEISIIMFYENIILGGASLISGIILGSLLGRIIINLYLKTLSIPYNIDKTLSITAIEKTIMVFSIIYIIVAFKNSRIIYKFKLIDLMNGDSTSEDPVKPKKNQSKNAIRTIITGYIVYIVFTFITFGISLFVTLTTVISGTYLLFNSYLINKLKNSKNTPEYYKGTNLITTNHLMYRIKSNARTLGTIAILIASTVTAMGASMSSEIGAKKSEKELKSSFHYAIISKDINNLNNIEALIKDTNTINNKLTVTSIDISGNKAFSNGNIHGISYSDYSKIKTLKGLYPSSELNSKEVIVLGELKDLISSDNKFTIYSGEKFNVRNREREELLNLGLLPNIVVFSDKDFNKIKSLGRITNIGLFNVDNFLTLNSKVYDFKNNLEKDKNDSLEKLSILRQRYINERFLSGTFFFVGMFMGLIFTMCTASIIMFKQVQEAYEEKERYETLKKLGFRKKEIKETVSKQLRVIFFYPLLVGLSHSAVALIYIGLIFGGGAFKPTILVAIPYSIVYSLYYLITRKLYLNIVY